MLKTTIKYLKRIIVALVIIISGYLLIALILSVISTNPEKLNCAKDQQIFISSNGVHLDIILLKEDLNEILLQELQISKNVKYVSIGWGDKGFYLETPTWSDLKFTTAAKAMFLNSETAMHITNYQRVYDDWVKVSLCDEQLEILSSYIIASFERNQEGKIVEIKNAGYTPYDKFYEAKGSYSCIQTCNNWVNDGLKAAKIETSIWSPFDKGILHQLKKK